MTGWLGRVTSLREIRNTWRILVGKPLRKEPHVEPINFSKEEHKVRRLAGSL
jgi:hypothetical protein